MLVAIIATVSVCGALLLVLVIAAGLFFSSQRQRQKVEVDGASMQVRCTIPTSGLLPRQDCSI